jgi:hypothetical protein
MNQATELKQKVEKLVGRPAEMRKDGKLSLSSLLIRVQNKQGAPFVFLPADEPPRFYLDSMVDAVHWALNGLGQHKVTVVVPADHLPDWVYEALESMVTACDKAGQVRLTWQNYKEHADELEIVPPTRPSNTLAQPETTKLGTVRLERWKRRMSDRKLFPESSQWNQIGADVPTFRWYRNVTDDKWSGRIAGWQVCTCSQNAKEGIWWQPESRDVPILINIPIDAIHRVKEFAARRRDPSTNNGGTKLEHMLEAGVLRGAVSVNVATGMKLSPVIKKGEAPFQFPALFGHNDNARYIDALMYEDKTPWVVELKVATAGQGQYYRHSITQAVLYRTFIQKVTTLHSWFRDQGLDAALCRAAIAMPRIEGVDPKRQRNSQIDTLTTHLMSTAAEFDVEVILLGRQAEILQQAQG